MHDQEPQATPRQVLSLYTVDTKHLASYTLTINSLHVMTFSSGKLQLCILTNFIIQHYLNGSEVYPCTHELKILVTTRFS